MENLLVKQFEDFNIEIYGTFENPLFKAKDIADILEIQTPFREFKRKFKLTFIYSGTGMSYSQRYHLNLCLIIDNV